MNHVVTIKPSMDRGDRLTVHPEKAAALGLGSMKSADISFGSQKYWATIEIDGAIPQDQIGLSQDLLQKLHIPDYPVYEIRLNRSDLVIGPHIGLLIANEEPKLTSSRLNKMLASVKEYAQIHGAIVLFALDQIDREKRLIEGYCYNPAKKYWQKGIFPYPSSIYRTIGLNTEWKQHFRSVIGDTLFNSRFFGKWEMYQWFSKEPEISPHLPVTVLYRSPQDIFDMLGKFPQIYIKPVLGLQGRGIARMSMEDGIFVLQYRKDGVNHRVGFDGPDQVSAYVKKRFRQGGYLIQQAIDLLQYKGGLVDFRCVVQKNGANTWVCPAIIGRSGVRDSIVSNISSGGAAFTAETILRRIIPASEEEIEGLKNRIAAFAVSVSSQLEKYGINCGTLGLDIGVDTQGHLWLIEINNRDPDPGIALDIRNTQLYYSLKAGPLLYAKFLAGFAEDSKASFEGDTEAVFKEES